MAMATPASNRTSTEHRGIFLLFVFILSVLPPVLFGQNLSTVQAVARLTEEYAPSSAARTALVLHAGAQAKLPSEEVALPHLQQPVEILVDRWGVPHIYAKNESELFFAQGYYVARERLFQIDLWRRRGLGHPICTSKNTPIYTHYRNSQAATPAGAVGRYFWLDIET
jgi:hypothetical protein